jgi:peptidoglycan/xylan/chitin deacetylase (PgdA/CDA1 family)
MSYAVVSCDLDPVDTHLVGYGFPAGPPCDLIYRRALPRLLELFAEIGLPGVFFVVARDAAAQRAVLRAAADAGHEVASHSLTHPVPFRPLSDARLADEVGGSRRQLEDVLGVAVAGFRAPAWDVDGRVLRHVAAAGYAYDASLYPTPALLLNRWAVYRRSPYRGAILSPSLLRQACARRRPHWRACGRSALAEFPLTVTRALRLPVYHTIAHIAPRPFDHALTALLNSTQPIHYQLHAVDLLDLERDGVDPRLAPHPGMEASLEEKRQLLGSILRRIAARRTVLTYREALRTLPARRGLAVAAAAAGIV